MIPIRYIVLEGPDCCGKTTLYSAIHRTTKFKYNVHDRSFLSMLCYARLYGRDATDHRESLHAELCDANNFLVVLMLPRDVLLQRLKDRGDEFQDASSLMRLYDIFEEEVEKLIDLPNVLVLRDVETAQDMASRVAMELQIYSAQIPGGFGKDIYRWTNLTSFDEVSFRVTFEVPVDHSDASVYDDPHEGDYYSEIRHKCEEVIRKEISGENPYGIIQGLDSRRFYYSSDTCISSIHFMPRAGSVKVICTLRSTDAVKNGSIDLRFLASLSSEIPKKFGWPADKTVLTVNFNSLHIRNDKA
jgi:hypothetical protein